MSRVQKAKIELDPVNPEEAAAARPRGPFRALRLQGLDRLATVLVAALTTEEPLLLIGPHGTAKTLLCTPSAQVGPF
jgi:MoxR-like ATPase